MARTSGSTTPSLQVVDGMSRTQDGARYEVRPNVLTILSNGNVDSAEPALEFSRR
jgi:hypothetical protein